MLAQLAAQASRFGDGSGNREATLKDFQSPFSFAHQNWTRRESVSVLPMLMPMWRRAPHISNSIRIDIPKKRFKSMRQHESISDIGHAKARGPPYPRLLPRFANMSIRRERPLVIRRKKFM
jgi:hypothetical protein